MKCLILLAIIFKCIFLILVKQWSKFFILNKNLKKTFIMGEIAKRKKMLLRAPVSPIYYAQSFGSTEL